MHLSLIFSPYLDGSRPTACGQLQQPIASQDLISQTNFLLSYMYFQRTLVTEKELKKYKIKSDDKVFFCKLPDSLERRFWECAVTIMNDFSNHVILKFNEDRKTHASMSMS